VALRANRSPLRSDISQVNRLKTDLQRRRVRSQPEIVFSRRDEERVDSQGMSIVDASAPLLEVGPGPGHGIGIIRAGIEIDTTIHLEAISGPITAQQDARIEIDNVRSENETHVAAMTRLAQPGSKRTRSQKTHSLVTGGSRTQGLTGSDSSRQWQIGLCSRMCSSAVC
jgi:hypothetical protein